MACPRVANLGDAVDQGDEARELEVAQLEAAVRNVATGARGGGAAGAALLRHAAGASVARSQSVRGSESARERVRGRAVLWQSSEAEALPRERSERKLHREPAQ